MQVHYPTGDKHLIETMMTVLQIQGGAAKNRALLYTILPIHEAVNYHLER